MPVSIRTDPYIIPIYSLTGDLLSYLKCPRQYRYYNRGALPPSAPVQLWFGEFIHGVMEEAFLRWRDRKDSRTFPWSWPRKIRDVETVIYERLAARGLKPPPPLFRPYENGQPDDRRIASFRAEQSINTWGTHLFPLIVEAEVRLSGTQVMPDVDRKRSDYYGITGIVDVVSSVRLQEATTKNKLVKRLIEEPLLAGHFKSSQPFDIIIDYKGMRRPSLRKNGSQDATWEHQAWQVQTYAWLRSLQKPDRKTVAGVLLYLNELYPSKDDLKALRRDLHHGETDVLPTGPDLDILLRPGRTTTSGVQLSANFREARSIRVLPIEETVVKDSLSEFSRVVGEIEAAFIKERSGAGVRNSWVSRPEASTCTACDFKYGCEGAKRLGLKTTGLKPTIP